MNKRKCIQCNKELICNVEDIKNCFCVGIKLNPAALDYAKKNYADCLCSSCLKKLNKERTESTTPLPSIRK